MQIKTRYRIIVLALITTFFCCPVWGQVGFPPSNTIYTVEDGREFVQLWECNNSHYDSLGLVESIRVHSNSQIGILASSAISLNQQGKILFSIKSPDVKKYFDQQGNTIFLLRRSYDFISKIGLRVINKKGRVIGDYHVDGPENYAIGDPIRKKDGSFILFENEFIYPYSPLHQGRYIAKAWFYSNTGELIKVVDLRETFSRAQRYVSTLHLHSDGCFYGVDEVFDRLHKFDGSLNILKSYPLKKPVGIRRNPARYLDKHGNLVITSASKGELYFYSLLGHFKKVVSLTQNDGKYFNLGTVGFFPDGRIIAFNLDDRSINIHDPDGKFKRMIFSSECLVNPVVSSGDDNSAYRGWNLTSDKANNLYSWSWDKIAKFSSDGVVVFNKKFDDKSFSSLKVNSRGILFAFGKNHVYQLDPEGNIFNSFYIGYGVERYGDRIAIAPDDTFYSFSSSQILRFSEEMVPMETIFTAGKGPRSLNSPNEIAIDSRSDIHILDYNHRIKVYSPNGKFLRRLKLPANLYGFDIDAEGNYYSKGRIYNPQGKLMSSPMSYADTFVICDSLQRAFAQVDSRDNNANGTISLSIKRLVSKSEKGTIRGTFRFNHPNIYEPSTHLVFIEGTTPNGTKYFSAAEVEYSEGEFSFSGIPLGSRYKIYSPHPRPDFYEFRTPTITGTLLSKSLKVTLTAQTIPEEYIRVKGVVADSNGHPVQGVRITAGDRLTHTNLRGQYVLTLPPDDIYTVRASKARYRFIQASKQIQVEKTDIMFLNFKERQNIVSSKKSRLSNANAAKGK